MPPSSEHRTLKLRDWISVEGADKRKYGSGKLETEFNLRINNHLKDVHKINTPEADQDFKLPGHIFNLQEKFKYGTGKSEKTFNVWLNKHQKNVYKINTPDTDQHFILPSHDFYKQRLPS